MVIDSGWYDYDDACNGWGYIGVIDKYAQKDRYTPKSDKW
jgi:hypothetical protein